MAFLFKVERLLLVFMVKVKLKRRIACQLADLRENDQVETVTCC
jgi:hypothetical protein